MVVILRNLVHLELPEQKGKWSVMPYHRNWREVVNATDCAPHTLSTFETMPNMKINDNNNNSNNMIILLQINDYV